MQHTSRHACCIDMSRKARVLAHAQSFQLVMSDAQVPICQVHFRRPSSQACRICLYCSLHTIRVRVFCLPPCMLPAAIALNSSCQSNSLHCSGTAFTCHVAMCMWTDSAYGTRSCFLLYKDIKNSNALMCRCTT